MNAFTTANLLGILFAGRNPEWKSITLGTDGATVPVTKKASPYEASSGVHLENTLLTRLIVRLREDLSRYGARVTVTVVDDTSTYSATINGIQFDYVAVVSDTAVEILEGIKAAINAGKSITTGLLTFADANPDTIIRASGSWITDGVTSGSQIVVDGTDVYTVDVVDSAVQVTLVGSDEVTAGAVTPTSVVIREQVTATTEARTGALVDTLVIRTRIGVDQADTIGAISGVPTSAQEAKIQDLATETTTFTVAVSATVTGELAYNHDATTCDVDVFASPRGLQAPDGWTRLPSETILNIDYTGADVMIPTSGQDRGDVAIRNANGIVAGVWLAPAVQET